MANISSTVAHFPLFPTHARGVAWGGAHKGPEGDRLGVAGQGGQAGCSQPVDKELSFSFCVQVLRGKNLRSTFFFSFKIWSPLNKNIF